MPVYTDYPCQTGWDIFIPRLAGETCLGEMACLYICMDKNIAGMKQYYYNIQLYVIFCGKSVSYACPKGKFHPMHLDGIWSVYMGISGPAQAQTPGFMLDGSGII